MAIKVYPGASNPSHQISLSDGVETWGLTLEGGEEAVQEIPLASPTSSLRGGLASLGDWENGMASMEQRSWHGGRGLDVYQANDADASSRFFDSMNAWTLTPGYLLPAPQWKMAEGLAASVEYLPGDMDWKGLFGDQLFVSVPILMEKDVEVSRVSIWVRRVGAPGELTVAIYGDDGEGAPGSVIATGSSALSGDEVEDVTSLFKKFLLESPSMLEEGQQYHLVIRGEGNANDGNHWEVGADSSEAGALRSGDGANWLEAGFQVYFRAAETVGGRTFRFFEHNEALYAIDAREDGTPSHLYLLGDRGVVDSASEESLIDTDKNWTPDQWAGTWLKIRNGKGQGQVRKVLGNTSTELLVSAWDILPDDSSDYFLGGTKFWQDVSPSSGVQIDGVVRDVAPFQNMVHFAQGSDNKILRMKFDLGTAPALHVFKEEGEFADFLHTFSHSSQGAQIYMARERPPDVGHAFHTSWGSSMDYGELIDVGNGQSKIRDLFDYSGSMWVLKENGLWQISEDDKAQGLNLGLRAARVSRKTCTVHRGDLFFGWGQSVVRYSGGRADLIGPGGELGLPSKRRGQISALVSMGPWLAAGIDAGEDGVSSVMLWDGSGWHELFRAPDIGERVQSLYWQVDPISNPRLWIGLGEDIVFIDVPEGNFTPLEEKGLVFQHEAVLEQGIVDMGAEWLPKFLKRVGVASHNLGTGVEVHLDYQLDEKIGGAEWQQAGAFYSSPLDSVDINVGQVHAIRTRLRLLSNQAKVPPVVRSMTIDGFARTPLKYQWNLRVSLGDLKRDGQGGLDGDPEAFMKWLKQAAREARRIKMRSIWEGLDGKNVIVEPPTLMRRFSNSLLTWWGGAATVVLREA